MIKLCVYVERDCWNCQEARALAQEMAEAFPQLHVEVVEMAQGVDRPDGVFAAPTFTLNGRVISLGNPTREALRRRIERTLNGG